MTNRTHMMIVADLLSLTKNSGMDGIKPTVLLSSANPINSSILPMRIVLSHILKSYIFFKLSTVMGKYSMVMLAFLIAGMIIAATSKPFNTPMFYSMLAGAVIVIGYTTWHNRKEHQRIKREKRKSRK